MPTYHFQCSACGCAKEDSFSMRGVPDSVVCTCGASADRRIVGFSIAKKSHAPGPTRSDLPSSFDGVGRSREGVAHFQRLEESISRAEQSDPGLVTLRAPVLSHEGPQGVVYASPRNPLQPKANA